MWIHPLLKDVNKDIPHPQLLHIYDSCYLYSFLVHPQPQEIKVQVIANVLLTLTATTHRCISVH